MAEIEVLVRGVQSIYMDRASALVRALSEERSYPNYYFRGERDYTPVFINQSINIPTFFS
jgi:hypothetical protein